MKFKDGLILGFLVGALAAIFCTPKTGEEVREEVKEKLNIIPKNFFNLLESILDLSVSVLDFAKESFQEQKEHFSNALSTGINAAREKTDELRKYASNIPSK